MVRGGRQDPEHAPAPPRSGPPVGGGASRTRSARVRRGGTLARERPGSILRGAGSARPRSLEEDAPLVRAKCMGPVPPRGVRGGSLEEAGSVVPGPAPSVPGAGTSRPGPGVPDPPSDSRRARTSPELAWGGPGARDASGEDREPGGERRGGRVRHMAPAGPSEPRARPSRPSRGMGHPMRVSRASAQNSPRTMRLRERWSSPGRPSRVEYSRLAERPRRGS